METRKYRQKLILTADDFGASTAANLAILHLAQLGKLDRVAVMANYPISQADAAALAGTGVKLDIHLDFFRNRKHTLKASAFIRSVKFVIGYLFGQNRSSRMEIAWIEQLDNFKNIFGRQPDGINSHQHIHFFPPYFRIALRLAKKYDIPFIRFGARGFMENASRIPRILQFFRQKNKPDFLASGLASTDFCVSLDWIEKFEKFSANLPDAKTELVIHPERKNEFELLAENV